MRKLKHQPNMAETTKEATEMTAHIGMEFETFDDVELFIKEYEEATLAKYYRSDSRTVESAKKRLPKRAMEQKLKYFSATFCCVHYGSFRSTSRGMRPNQKSMRKGCPAKIRFAATVDGLYLTIVELVKDHNHPLNEESFRTLPQKRRLNSREKEEACLILQKKGKRSAQKHLKETTGKEVSMKDLHNLAFTSRQQAICYNNIQAILDHLSETEDQSSVVEVVTKADGKIVGIYYQDQEMMRMYASYPEYLTVDATCKTNNLKMPLYAMLIEDSNGDYEIVAVFLVLSANVDSVRSMVMRFKEHNPTWNLINVVAVDKDWVVLKVMEEEFPLASSQIGQYYVLRSISQELSNECMELSREEKAHCLKLIKKLVASKSLEVYIKNYKQLQNTKLEKVIEYYDSIWHINRKNWVEGLKLKSLTLKVETSKKLETVESVLKDVFSDSPAANEAMANLKRAIESLREERDHAAAELLANDPQEKNLGDSMVGVFQKYVTPLAMKHILRQMKLSWQVSVKSNTSRNSCSVKSSGGILIVNLNCCPCRFWSSLCLPCRHIFAVRRFKGLSLFDKEAIGSRWTMEHYKSVCRLSAQDASLLVQTGSKKNLSLLSQQERLAMATEITQELAQAAAESPVEAFAEHLNSFRKAAAIIKKGSTCEVTEVPSNLPAQEPVSTKEVENSTSLPAVVPRFVSYEFEEQIPKKLVTSGKRGRPRKRLSTAEPNQDKEKMTKDRDAAEDSVPQECSEVESEILEVEVNGDESASRETLNSSAS